MFMAVVIQLDNQRHEIINRASTTGAPVFRGWGAFFLFVGGNIVKNMLY
jgi:hypothetical protein